jgi:cation:H+ antiporter
MNYIILLYFILSCLILVLAGSVLVKSLSRLAWFLRISEFLAAFVIMGLSTTLPELSVGITSAVHKNSALALGNVIGSNIVNLTLIAGIAIVLARKIRFKHLKVVRQDSLFMFVIVLLPLVLMLLGNGLSRIDGGILVGVFLFYFWRLFRERGEYRKELENHVKRWSVVIYSFLFLISLVVVFFSADWVVTYGQLLAIELSLPTLFIGLFFVAIGTSIPELVFGVISVRTKHSEFAVGDLMGAVVINSTLVLGVTALIHPITAGLILFLTSSLFMIVATWTFVAFVLSGWRLSWAEGISLIMIYVLFLIVELNLRGFF